MTGITSLTGVYTPDHGFITRDALAGLLERQILSGELAAGTRLPSERTLAERFHVSRPVVREALRGLAERRLVDVAPGRGTFVRTAQASDAAVQLTSLYRHSPVTPRQLVEARMMLECTAAELAAERAEPADLALMRRANVDLERSTSIVEQARHDLVLHFAVVRASRNAVVEVMFTSIAMFTLELMLRSLSDAEVTTASLPYHHAIVDAIAAGDPAAARVAMAAHLDVATRLYGEDFDRSLEHVAREELGRLLADDSALDELLSSALGGRPSRPEHDRG